MTTKDTTVIIYSAGEGSRLGIGSTKSLIKIDGESLILHQLKQLDDFDDVRLVVGYQAERMIDVVTKYRKDVMFAFNYDYHSTGPLASVEKAMLGARKYTAVLGGDLFVHPEDFRAFLSQEGPCLGVSPIHSQEPVYLDVNEQGQAVAFREGKQHLEWAGLAKFESALFSRDHYYVYQMLEQMLPLPTITTRAIDIDTSEDYEKVVEWVKSGYAPESY